MSSLKTSEEGDLPSWLLKKREIAHEQYFAAILASRNVYPSDGEGNAIVTFRQKLAHETVYLMCPWCALSKNDWIKFLQNVIFVAAKIKNHMESVFGFVILFIVRYPVNSRLKLIGQSLLIWNQSNLLSHTDKNSSMLGDSNSIYVQWMVTLVGTKSSF